MLYNLSMLYSDRFVMGGVCVAGCQLCSGLHNEKIGACAAIFVRMYAEAFARLTSAAIMQGL